MSPIAQKGKFHIQTNALGILNFFFDTLVIVCCHFVVPCQHSDLFVIPHLPSSMLFVNNIFLHPNRNTQQNVSLLDYHHSPLLEIPHIHNNHGIQI